MKHDSETYNDRQNRQIGMNADQNVQLLELQVTFNQLTNNLLTLTI